MGEDRWDEFDVESISDQTEANTKEELSLKDIMDSITDPAEKVMLVDPFKSVAHFNTTARRNTYDIVRKYLNSRFDREGSLVDIERIQQYFCLDDDEIDYRYFCVEFVLFHT